jgi:acetylglutamate kinase
MSAITVVKIGGNEVDDAGWLAALADSIASHSGRMVLVHGGGKEISRVQSVLGDVPMWREGLRVTTPAAMRAVSMALTGVVNKRIASALLTAGVDAVGISGEDGALIRARLASDGRLGRVGVIESVRSALLRTLLDEGLTPVVSPVSRAADGGAVNVNADDAAAAIALALGAAELLLISNVAGVRDHVSTLREVDAGDIEGMVTAGAVTAGMIPKLRAAARASERGVPVRVGDLAMLGKGWAGTRIRATALVDTGALQAVVP